MHLYLYLLEDANIHNSKNKQDSKQKREKLAKTKQILPVSKQILHQEVEEFYARPQ